MKQQIIFFPWAVPKENFKDYYEFLETREYDPYKEKFLNWNKILQENLGDDYEILRAAYDGIDFADYEAWKIMFEKMFPYVRENPIVITTSLGSTFLLKYLSETLPPNPLLSKEGEASEVSGGGVSKLFFLAPALNSSPLEDLWTFELDKQKLKNIPQDIADEIYIYHSSDDEIVDISDSRELLEIFPNATFREFDDRGHWYLEESIPEIEADIKK